MSLSSLLSSRKDNLHNDLKFGCLIFGFASLGALIINIIFPLGLLTDIIELIVFSFFFISIYNYSINQPKKESFLYKEGRKSAVMFFIFWIISIIIVFLSSTGPLLPENYTQDELAAFADHFLIATLILVIASIFFLLGAFKFTNWFNVVSNNNGTVLVKVTAITKLISAIIVLFSAAQLFNAANLFNTTAYEEALTTAVVLLGIGGLFNITSSILQIMTGIVLYSRLDNPNTFNYQKRKILY